MPVIHTNTSLSSTLELGVANQDSGDLLRGEGSRRVVLTAQNSLVNPVVRVHCLLSKPIKSVVIENLIIDGGGLPGVTGILLENVVHCLIRNVTIRNCEVGVHIRSYKGLWSEGNVLKHVCMENVKKGVVFTTTGPYKWNMDDPPYPGSEFCSDAFTTLDGVDISLKDNDADAVGIQVGGIQITTDPDPNGVDTYTTDIKPCDDAIVLPSTNLYATGITPYSSHFRVRVRLGSAGGAGLRILNGKLYWAQAHLTVIKEDGSPGGIGIDIPNHPVKVDKDRQPERQDRVVWENQFSDFYMVDELEDGVITPKKYASLKGFMLVVGSNIATPISPLGIVADVQVKTLPP